jgi:hypothetical protein
MVSHSDESLSSDYRNQRKLWWILVAEADNRHGDAKVRDVLDAAEDCGVSRFEAAEALVRWLESGRIRKSYRSNRVVPQRRGYDT